MPRTPSNVPWENRAPGFAGGYLRFRVPASGRYSPDFSATSKIVILNSN